MRRTHLMLLLAALLPWNGCSTLEVEELLEASEAAAQANYDAAAADAVEAMRRAPCSEIAAADMARTEYEAATMAALRRATAASRGVTESNAAQDRVPMPPGWCRNEGDGIAVLVDGRRLGTLPLDWPLRAGFT